MKLKLYLDDERETPTGWHRAYTAPEACEILGLHQVEVVSLDHDLGLDDGVGNGYDVLLWIEEQVYTNPDYVMPSEILIHTANPSAATKMVAARNAIYKEARKRGKLWNP